MMKTKKKPKNIIKNKKYIVGVVAVMEISHNNKQQKINDLLYKLHKIQ